jgi:hypothetical protein
MMSGVPLEAFLAVDECWNGEFRSKVASCWLFILSHTAMHGFMNIKGKYKSTNWHLQCLSPILVTTQREKSPKPAC